MRVVYKNVAMVGVDLDSLDESEDNHEAIAFDIMLSHDPDPKWVEEFEIAYRQTPYVIKPPLTISGDRMTIEFLPRYSDELQPYIDFLQTIVDRADQEVRMTLAIQKHGHMQEHIDDFRKNLQTLDFTRGKEMKVRA
jgi:hypothetical protein